MVTASIVEPVSVNFSSVGKIDTVKMTADAYKMCRDANMADDIVQAALTAILLSIRKSGEFEVDNLEAFLNTGMKNAFFKILRSKKRQRIEHSDNAAETIENLTAKSAEEDSELMQTIPFNQQERILIGHLTFGLTTSDICSMMEISKENFWKISQRIRDKVRDSIE